MTNSTIPLIAISQILMLFLPVLPAITGYPQLAVGIFLERDYALAYTWLNERTTETDVTTQGATLAHEVAHSLLHWTADGKKITTRDGKEIDKQQRELEAEATAYTVCSFFGVKSPSEFYLAAYKATPAMLLEAVEIIATTVKTILNGCQPAEVEETANVTGQELSQVCAA